MRETSGTLWFSSHTSLIWIFLWCSRAWSTDPVVDSSWLNLGTARIIASSTLGAGQGASPALIQTQSWSGQNIGLPDLLATLPGIQTRKTGGLGSPQTISIRGVAGHRVLICLDGVPLNDGFSGAVNLGAIDLNQLQSIEIWKGYVPARFGGNSLGGLINLRTRSEDKRSAHLILGYGSHQTGESALSIAAALRDSLRWSSALSWRFSDNDYSYKDRNGTPYNPDDDRVATRRNAAYEQWSGAHTWSWTRPSATWRVSLTHSRENGGIAGNESQETKIAGFSQEWAQSRIAYLGHPALWRTESELSLRINRNQLRWSSALDGLGYHYGDRDYQETGCLIWRVEPAFRLLRDSRPDRGVEWSLASGIEQATPRAYPEIPASWGWTLRRHSARQALEGFAEPLPGIRTSASYQSALFRDANSGGVLRSTYLDTIPADTQITWKQGAQFALVIGSNSSSAQAHLSAGRHYRVPDLTERFSTHLGTLPNPDLKPEEGWSAETGVAWRRWNSAWRATLFTTRIHQGVFYRYSAGFSKPDNLEKTRTDGLELEMESSPLKRLRYILRGTFQDPRNLSEIPAYRLKLLPNEPRTALYAECRVRLLNPLEISYRAEWHSVVFRDPANQMRVPAQDNHHASLAWDFGKSARLQLSASNLAGGDYQVVYAAYPTPGRQFYASWTQRF